MPRTVVLALAVVALVVVPLAGCIGGAGPSNRQTPSETEGTAPGGSPENASSPDEVPHVHDRWDGQTERTLFDGTVSTGSSTDVDPSEGLLTNAICVALCAAVAPFQPAEGEIVPPGTDEVTVTASWSDQDAEPAARTDVRLIYRAANMTDHRWLDAKDPSATWTIDTTVPMADGGHAKESLWDLQLIASTHAGNDSTVEATLPRIASDEMQFEVSVVAHRTDGPLPVAPPHPDWWADGPDRHVVARQGPARSAGVGSYYVNATAGTQGSIEGGTAYTRIDGDEHDPIPPGSRVLVATVNWTNDAPNPGPPGPRPWLSSSDGTGFVFQAWQPERVEDGHAVFVMAIHPDQTDGLYQQGRSRWSFLFGFEGQPDTGIPDPVFSDQTVTGPYAFQGSWDLQIRAYNTTDLPSGLPSP